MSPRYYLSLEERYSQVWSNKVTVVLLLLAAKVFLFLLLMNQMLDHIADLVVMTEASLQRLEAVTSDFPDQVVGVLNKLLDTQLTYMVESFESSILLLVSVLKAIISFYVDVFLGTYTCLIDAAARGSVNMAIESVQATVHGINATVVAVTREIDSGLQHISSFIENSVNSLLSIFSDEVHPVSSIKLSLGKLKNLHIPSSVSDKLDSFLLKVDTFDSLTNSSIEAVTAPITIFANNITNLSHFQFKNHSMFSNVTIKLVGAKKHEIDMSEIKKKIEAVRAYLNKIALTVMVTLLALSFLVIIIYWFRERSNFTKRQNLVTFLLERSQPFEINNALSIYENHTLSYMDKLKVHHRFFWIINYLTTKYALLGLSIGLLGIISFLIQYCLLQVARGKIEELSASMPAFTSRFLTQLSNYSDETNAGIQNQAKMFNHDMLGWYTESSISVNQTLTDFLGRLNSTIYTVTGNTPLSKPFEVVVYCVIGRKIIAVTQGITWLHDHLQLKLPEVPLDLFENIADIVPPAYKQQLQEKMQRATSKLANMLYIELYISIGFVFAWIVLVLIGIIIITFSRKQSISGPHLLTEIEKDQYIFPVSTLNVSLSKYSTLNSITS